MWMSREESVRRVDEMFDRWLRALDTRGEAVAFAQKAQENYESCKRARCTDSLHKCRV